MKSKVSKITRILAVLLMLCLVIPMVFACSEEEKEKTDKELIIERIETFVEAYNEGDIDAVLDCLDSKSKTEFEMMLKFLGWVAGTAAETEIDLEAIFKDLFSLGVNLSSGDFMDLEINEVIITDDSAVVVTVMGLKTISPTTMYFDMVRQSGKWRIHNITDTDITPDIDDGDNDGTGNGGTGTGNGGTGTGNGGTGTGNGGTGNGGTGGGENIPDDTDRFEFNSIASSEDGISEVSFYFDGDRYNGLANADGELFFYSSNYFNWRSIGAGCVLAELYDTYGGEESFQIISADGAVVADSSKGDFDFVVGYGDGLVLVYKDTSTMTKEEHSYGVVNAAAGNWYKTYSAREMLPETRYDPGYIYMGSDIFGYNSIYYNCNTGRACVIEDAEVICDRIVNGCIYVKSEGYHGGDGFESYGTFYPTIGVNERVDLPEFAAINATDLTVTAVSAEEFSKAYNKIYAESTDEGVKIIAPGKTSPIYYTEYPEEVVDWDVRTSGNYVLIKINGKDGKYYFTVVNEKGERQFDPIEYNYSGWSDLGIFFSEERVVFKTVNDNYAIVDAQGNMILSSDAGYLDIQGYDGGVARAYDDDRYILLGLDGKVIDITFKK